MRTALLQRERAKRKTRALSAAAAILVATLIGLALALTQSAEPEPNAPLRVEDQPQPAKIEPMETVRVPAVEEQPPEHVMLPLDPRLSPLAFADQLKSLLVQREVQLATIEKHAGGDISFSLSSPSANDALGKHEIAALLEHFASAQIEFDGTSIAFSATVAELVASPSQQISRMERKEQRWH